MKKLTRGKFLILVLTIVIIALAVAGSYSWFVAIDSSTFTGRISDIINPLGEIEKTSSVYEVQPGESFEYTIKASNSADATDTWKDVSATDKLDSNLSYVRFEGSPGVTVTNNNGTLTMSFGDIPAGEAKEVKIYVTVSTDAEPGITINNSVAAKGSNDPSDLPITDKDPEPPVIVDVFGSITKIASVDTAQVGQSFDYTISVTNTGTTEWKNVIATDDLNTSGKLDYVSSVSGNDITISESGGVVTINFGNISVGVTKTVRINVSVKTSAALGTLNNTVTAVSDNHAPVNASYPITVIGADEYITKRAGTGAVIQGETYTYSITVGNNSSATWENVVATDQLDTSLITYASCLCDQSVTVNDNNGVLTINFGNIEPGASKTAIISVTVNWGVPAETKILNSVIATGSNGGGSKTAEDPMQPVVQGTSLKATKTSNRSEPTREGDRTDYTINVKNNGNAPIYDVVVYEEIPEGLNLVSGSVEVNGITTNYSLSNGVLSVYLGNLAIDETAVITYSVYVTADAIGKSIENIGTTAGFLNKYHDPSDAPDVSIDFYDNNKSIIKPGLLTEHLAYIIGYSDGTVRPEKKISRAEATTIVFRLLSDGTRNFYWSKTNDYSDVSSSDWYNNAVSTMTKAEIIFGYPEGTFGGNNSITRAEFAVILDRLDKETAYTGEDKFSDISGHYAAEYINRAAEKGWVQGYGDGKFKPDQDITRAEAMTMVNRILGRANIAEMHKDMTTWPDNPTTAWYYKAVLEATNSHEYTRDENEYERWTRVFATLDWAALEKSWSQANG